jgi:phospholipid transport system substrate-binding protein
MTKTLLISALALGLAAAGSAAAPAEGAEKTLRQAVDQVLGVTSNSKGGRAMADKLRPILERHICFESMTRRAVGPGWRQFTPAQRAEATKLFTRLIIRSYSDRFTPGESPRIEFLKATAPAPNRAEIPTSVVYRGGRYTVTYRLENRGGWLVTDILAEGVSLVANYRAQFDELYRRGGAQAVLDSLQQSVSRQT